MPKKKVFFKSIHFVALFISIAIISLAIILGWGKLSKKYPEEKVLAFASESLKPAEDHIIVKFKETVSDRQENTILRSEGSQKQAEAAKNVSIVSVPADQTPQEFVAEIKSDYGKQINYAETDQKAAVNMIPNDPEYFREWHLPKISAPQAWDIEQGDQNVIVAVLDTGRANHPDVAAKFLAGYNFVDNNTNPQDGHGHGTFVSGIIAAVTNNNLGIAGSAPNVKILPIKVLSDGGWGYYSWIASGITWATDHGANVINMSLGGSSNSQIMQDAISYANSKGVVVVASSGNSGTSAPSYPAACSSVISVGATDSSDAKASFSQYGSTLDVMAPGVSVFSTRNDGSYGYWSGTSFSSPIVSALAGLIKSKSPGLNPIQIENIIEQNTDDLGSAGKDQYFGWGRVNYYKALGHGQGGGSATISGQVTDSFFNGAVSGAAVVAYQGDSAIDSTSSLADGSYSLSNLPIGAYSIRASQTNYATNSVNAEITSEAQQLSGINITCTPYYASFVGRVADWRTRSSLHRATVILYLGNRVVRKTWTYSNGYYYIKNVPAGHYGIMVSYPGYYTQSKGAWIGWYQMRWISFTLHR